MESEARMFYLMRILLPVLAGGGKSASKSALEKEAYHHKRNSLLTRGQPLALCFISRLQCRVPGRLIFGTQLYFDPLHMDDAILAPTPETFKAVSMRPKHTTNQPKSLT